MGELIQQWPADEPVVQPTSTFLSACAAVNWVAFRRAEDGDLTGQAGLRRDCGYDPVEPPNFNPFDYAVAEAAGKLTSDQHAWMQGWISRMQKEPRELPHLRQRAAETIAASGWSALEFHIYLGMRRQWWISRSAQLWSAQRSLTLALAAEKLVAFATRAVAAEPERGHHQPRAVGIAVAVPWQFFLTPGACVWPSGAITADTDPGYLHAQFRAAEVLKEWPVVLTPVAESPQLDASAGGEPRSPRGRSFESQDAPLLDEMAVLIRSGQARGPMDAALLIASKAEGKNPDAIARRLAGKFNKRAATQSAQSGQSISSL